MACIRYCLKANSNNLRQISLLKANNFRHLCSSTSPTDFNNEEQISYTSVDEETRDFSALRNVSRLTETLHKKLKHELSDAERNILHANTTDRISYERRLYATYGKKSGINPAIMWPSLEELKETIEDEKEWDKSLAEMISEVKKSKSEKMKAMLEKDQLIEARMKEMPKYIEKYRQQLRQKQAEIELGRQRQDKMLEEARDFFGYEISRSDPQFKAYVENKKEEEAKMLKKQKKEKRAAERRDRYLITGEEKPPETQEVQQ